MRIDPWASELYEYDKLRDIFGISEFNFELPHAHKVFRRGIVFGHRGFESIYRAINNKKKFVILTGLAPSGKMHLGHKLTIDQVIYYQSIGAHICIVIADVEAYAVRGVPLQKAREIALEEYLANYIALGLRSERCEVYAQSRRKAVLDLVWQLGTRTNLSEAKAIYGFGDDVNLAHFYIPLLQAGDILHPQLDDFHGPTPTLVPVGVDQDPHIRYARDLASRQRLFNVTFTRDQRVGVFVKSDTNVGELLAVAERTLTEHGFRELDKIVSYKALYVDDATREQVDVIDELLIPLEKKHGGYAFYPPAATVHKLMMGLTGGKMSSSKPETAIFLTDSARELEKKIMACKTGGGVSLEEHKREGGKPEVCAVYELLLYHFLEDDARMEEVYRDCKAGQRACGKCKNETLELAKSFLGELAEKRAPAKERVQEYLAEDTL
jgi:tryptophanyl-tRNA synthetase